MLSPRMTWRPESGTSSTPACRAKCWLHEQTEHAADDSSGAQQVDVVCTLLENTLSWHSAKMRFVIWSRPLRMPCTMPPRYQVTLLVA